MDKEIIRLLCNTIALYGGKDDILSIIKDLQNDEIKTESVERLRKWNYDKTDEIKNRLLRCTGKSVSVTNLN